MSADTPDALARGRRRPVLTMRRFLGVGSVMLLLVLSGIPGIEGEDVAVLNTVHARLTAAFDGARVSARGSQRPHGVAVDVIGDRFVLVDDRGRPVPTADLVGAAGAGGSADLVDGDAGVFASVAAPPSLASLGADVVSARFGKGGATAVFGRDGLPLAGGEVVVKIGEIPVTWVLDAATGRVLPQAD